MHSGLVRRIAAVEQEFPDGVPADFVAALSVHLLPERWMLSVNVRPGTEVSVRQLAERWAVREVMRLASDPAATSEWEEEVLPEGILMMRKYATVDYLCNS